MKAMSARDAVWLGILLRRRGLKSKPPAQIRRILVADGFPQRIITAYLLRREEAPK